MSSPASNLRKIKRSPLPSRGSGVPFRQAPTCTSEPGLSEPVSALNIEDPIILDSASRQLVVDGIRRSKHPQANRKDNDLLSSMAHRLAVIEKELLQTKREVIEKDEQIHRLQTRLATVEYSSDLEQKCLSLQGQIEEMEDFLNDYGMVWVGSDSGAVAGHSDDGMWCPGQSLPQPVDFNKIVKHIRDLNSLCSQTEIKNTTKGATIKASEPIPLALFKNGLVMFQGPFRPYSDPSTQQCIQDFTDGYFPTELQSRYPDGVLFQLTDLRETEFEARDMFPGSGKLLGGENGPSRLVDSQTLKGPVVSDIPGPKQSIDKFLSKIPTSVVKRGKVIDIRSSIAHTLQGCGTSVEVVSTPVINELRSRLEVTEDSRPPTPSHTTTLRIRTPDKTYVLKLQSKDTIETVKQYMDKHLGCSDYQLQSSFPPRSYSDLKQTLAQCGLSPNSNLFIVFNKSK